MPRWDAPRDAKVPHGPWQKEILGEWQLVLRAGDLVDRKGDDQEAEKAVKKPCFSTNEERNENVIALYWCGKL